jgi:predicted XRE-type DNA-binding protein
MDCLDFAAPRFSILKNVVILSKMVGIDWSLATISDNFFEDLGFEPIEAANLKLRTDLILKLRQFIRSRNWTQAEAASFFGETPAQIGNLMDINSEHSSIDNLIHLLLIAGMNVRISVTP